MNPRVREVQKSTHSYSEGSRFAKGPNGAFAGSLMSIEKVRR